MRNHASVRIAASILNADFAGLVGQVAEAQRSGDRIIPTSWTDPSYQVSAIGAPIVQSLQWVTHLAMEMQLMIPDPQFFIDEFVAAGSDSFLVPWEGKRNPYRTVERMWAFGKRAGVAIKPGFGARGDSAECRSGADYDG